MGQSSSTANLLQCMLTNFSSFQQKALDLGAICDAFTLRKLCELDWPARGHWICLQPMGGMAQPP
jgi:hypothetical protein